MADKTPIEWTDATWNIITGCSVVSAGCKHCYAMRLAGTRLRNTPSRFGLTQQTKAGPVWTGNVRFNLQWEDQPLRWRKPRRIFVCAHGDLFHEAVPFQWLDRIFAIMAIADRHTFQVLTKRPEVMHRYCSDPATLGRIIARIHELTNGVPGARFEVVNENDGLPGFHLPNVWLGVSVEDQAAANERIPRLLETPAAVRWISAEPLLGLVDLRCITTRGGMRFNALNGIIRNDENPFAPTYARCAKIDWVVDGGESGPGARPANPEWYRRLRDDCAAAGVKYLHKQNGAWAQGSDLGDHIPGSECVHFNPDDDDDRAVWLVGKKAAGRLLDGREHNGFPEVHRG